MGETDNLVSTFLLH